MKCPAKVLLAPVLVALVVAIGCKTPENSGSGGSGQPADGGQINAAVDAVPAHWKPTPLTMRVYPSTRFIREKGRPILEARVELLDEMGDPVKAAGTLVFELVSGDSTRRRDVGQRLYKWDEESPGQPLSLMTLADQEKFYDPITRAYLFRLTLQDLKPSRQTVTLEITLTQPDGTRLTARKVFEPSPVREVGVE